MTTEVAQTPVRATSSWPKLPWNPRRDIVAVLIAYLLSRIFSGVILYATAMKQVTPHPDWTMGRRPDYFTYVARMWDASWYAGIASHGYPTTLPVDAAGNVIQSNWAFFPLYPMICKAFTSVGIPWNFAAPTVSFLLGAVAVVLVYMLVRDAMVRWNPSVLVAQESWASSATKPTSWWRRAWAWNAAAAEGWASEDPQIYTQPSAVVTRARWIAFGTVLLLIVFPSSPVMQVAYTESLALVLIAGSLFLLVRRNYWLCVALVLLLGLTRAVALPFAVVVVVHYLARRWSAKRGIETSVSRSDTIAMAVLAFASVVSGFMWQTIMALVTGRWDAYLQTQIAWRWFDDVRPIVSWFDMANHVLKSFGVLVLIVLVLFMAYACFARHVFVLGPELPAWAGFYLLFLFGVAEPQTSTPRFLLLAFPLAAITLCLSKSRAYLVSMVTGFAFLQIAWVVMLWTLNAPSGFPP